MSENKTKNVIDIEKSIDSRSKGMITNVKTVVLYRENLCQNNIDKDFKDIQLDDFMYERSDKITPFKYACIQEIIIFIDHTENCRTKILKNRWGRTGEVK